MNAFWTFHYEEFPEAHPWYKCMPVGKLFNILCSINSFIGCYYRQALNISSTYYARNHEIDIEFPGRNNDGTLDGIR